MWSCWAAGAPGSKGVVVTIEELLLLLCWSRIGSNDSSNSCGVVPMVVLVILQVAVVVDARMMTAVVVTVVHT